VANFIHQVASSLPEVESEILDPLDFEMPYDGNDEENKDMRYSQIADRADGFMIVLPEYNNSYPGTLKRFLDNELKKYIHKPAAMASVSSGPWGGVRAIESLVPVLRELGLAATFTDVQFPHVKKLFNEQGEIQDEKYVMRVKRSYKELIWMAKTLKWGRENLSDK